MAAQLVRPKNYCAACFNTSLSERIIRLRSTIVMFRDFRRIEGGLAALKCRVEYLRPDWWRKAFRLGKSADQGERWKAHLEERAQAMFPRGKVTLKIAHALLILGAGDGAANAPKRTSRTKPMRYE